MPWSIHERDGKFCVVKDADGSVVHCHPTREKALAQQRALYANEPAVNASLELDTNSLFEEFMVEQQPQKIEIGPAPVRIEVAHDPSAVDAIVASLHALSERLLQSEENMASMALLLKQITENAEADRTVFQEALTASLSTDAPPPVVNVTVPEPVVNVNVPAPNVVVEVPSRRSIKLERDPFGTISGASIEEE